MLRAESTLRFDVPSRELLERLVSDPLPFDLKSGTVERRLFRDVYFDTDGRDLGRRGVICRFRSGSDDRRTLTVEIREPVGGNLVTWRKSEADVAAVDPIPALTGSSQPARMLRGVVDPGRLVARVDLEVEQWVRPINAGPFSRTRFEILYDVVTVHRDDRSLPFQELVIRRVRKGPPSLEFLVERFQARYDLNPMLASQLERAEGFLSELEKRGGEAGPLDPWISLVVLREGNVALLGTGDSYALPSGPGRGEATARELAGEIFDNVSVDRLLGSVNRPRSRKNLEVWLAFVRPDETDASSRVDWLPFRELLGRAGSPMLRDADTLGAINLAARTSIFATQPDVPQPAPPPPPDADSARDSSRAELLKATRSTSRSADSDFQSSHYLNAELSNLEFNARVLALAEDENTPLLARVRFLSIFSSNLDEFFMVRVGGLQRDASKRPDRRSVDGMTPQQQLDAISVRVRQLLHRQRELLTSKCLPALESHGIRLLTWEDLSDEDRKELTVYFATQIFPILTPHAITRAPGHPFPQIGNLQLAIAVMVSDVGTGRTHFGSIDVPGGLPRFIRLEGRSWFVPLEEIIKNNMERLYTGRRVEGAYCFRVTRSGDLDLDEEAADSLLEAVEEEVKRRPYAGVVRLEVEKQMPQAVRDLLQRELQYQDASRDQRLGDVEVQEVTGLMDMASLSEIASLSFPEIDYALLDPKCPFDPDRSIFDIISERDRLVYAPYDSFDDTTQRLIVEAANDENVTGIRLTLYRAGGRSAIVDALIAAASAGKAVDVFVELKARFDEQRNIGWARRLEQAGIHVVTGLVKLKTHAKTTLIVRREEGRIRRYVHIGTGNYNSATAKLYTDLGLLSADEDIAEDLNDMFNELMGSSGAPRKDYRRLLVAPVGMLRRFLDLIAREAEHARNGRKAGIKVKVNGLEDPEVINALYRASQAGVPIDLVVRSLCSLRPGVPGVSDTVRVVSILGRFLEHARIFYFENDGEPEYYIGSADWRPRNLRRRVEVATPVTNGTARERLDRILSEQIDDPTAWILMADGSYTMRAPLKE